MKKLDIVKMCESGELERVRHGYYRITDRMEIPEEKMIETFFEEGIVCMESTLFYYGYSDKTPLEWTIAAPRTITCTKIEMDNEIFNKAVNAYVADERKNPGNLTRYARGLKVYKKVTELMEVMLNG